MKNFYLGNGELSLSDYEEIVEKNVFLSIDPVAIKKLNEVRSFVDYLLEKNITAYGLTTGFADLRRKSVSCSEASELSCNILKSHDGGIGEPIPKKIVKGAMIISANSLSRGFSGFSQNSLNTLIGMINANIIPIIPNTGSLGASGDLAFLARLGRCMQGHPVPVSYEDQIIAANEALNKSNIPFFEPQAKEGLALTNGTSFMTSMLATAFLEETAIIENVLILISIFLGAVGATNAAFCKSIHEVRSHEGQQFVAETISNYISSSSFIDSENIQDDYCIRCIPQILGPLCDSMKNIKKIILKEMNSITDNPLIFKNKEISSDIPSNKRFKFNGEEWAIVSGGNFHGEYLANAADRIAMVNSKLAFILERQITYALNPARNNKKLPIYLIVNCVRAGIQSGYMITQYTANALTQKIAYLGNPVSTYNITSANESEDIVSYGANATQKLLQQQEYLKQLLSIYLTVVSQSYAIQDELILSKTDCLLNNFFNVIQHFHSDNPFPTLEDHGFEEFYQISNLILNSKELIKLTDYPFESFLDSENREVFM